MLVSVRVSTNCPSSSVEDCGDFLKVRVKAKPIEGRANAEVIELVARHFQVTNTAVTVIRGKSSSKKTLNVVKS